MPASIRIPDALSAGVLSIAIVGPEERRRKIVAGEIAGCQGVAIREFSSYPLDHDYLQKVLEQNYDVVLIDLDSDPEYALDLVESICAHNSATVIVYSAHADPELLVRCMQAGAREFLTLPCAPGAMAEALVRISVRRPATLPSRKAVGRLFVFLGAKGGSGVTTIACNFAVSLAHDLGQNTLLIDLDLPLGDAALDLGITAEYSTVNALQDSDRLDSNLLSRLLVRHSSGLQVLAAPGKFPLVETSNEAIGKLLAVARMGFDNVVVDAGSGLDSTGAALLKEASTIYLVTQVSIPELRNANRLIGGFVTTGGPNLEIVLNRYKPGSMDINDEQIEKALSRPVKWQIPNDYAVVRQMQNTATPLVLQDSPISRMIRQMAGTACGLRANPDKKKGFSFFR
jgi:pilus assembly protein CpaE